MKYKINVLSFFIFLYPVIGSAQNKQNTFDLEIINNSQRTLSCTVLGSNQMDSVAAKQKKTIHFVLDKEMISFFLELGNSVAYKRIRILNTNKSKQITVTQDNEFDYTLSPSEQVIETYNPQLRTKNFWKLDSVIKRNSGDIAAAEIIYLSLCDVDVKTDTIKKYFNFLSPRIKASDYGMRIRDYLVARSQLNKGNKIKSFKLSDTTGKYIRMDAIKSDYILLDFWFSRCGPCIMGFPELKKLYAETSRKKFEIIGISIDNLSENELWKSTVKKYNLPWVNLNDIKAAIVRQLAIVNYPTRVLLDKDRKVKMVDTNNSNDKFYQEVRKLIK